MLHIYQQLYEYSIFLFCSIVVNTYLSFGDILCSPKSCHELAKYGMLVVGSEPVIFIWFNEFL